MSIATAEKPSVAKKAGRPKKPSGEGWTVRLNPDLVAKAKIITYRRKLQLGEYLDSLLTSLVDRDYQRVLRELADEEGRKK